MSAARSVHDQIPESFKREAVDQMLAGTPLRHVAETLGIAWANGSASTNSKVTTPFLAMASSAVRMPSFAGYASNWPKSPWSANRHLLAAHEVRFRAIEALAGRYPVAPMCRL